jgi:hypothetical protein
MYFLIFLFLAVLFAIPTYGVSLVIFFLVKNWFDNKAAKIIINSAIISLKSGEHQHLHYINQAAIRKVFNAIGTEDCKVERIDDQGAVSFVAPVNHPKYAGTTLLNVIYTVRSGTKNTIIVNAQSL